VLVLVTASGSLRRKSPLEVTLRVLSPSVQVVTTAAAGRRPESLWVHLGPDSEGPKSDLRNHRAIVLVQPRSRWYDRSMVTQMQVTQAPKTESPHGLLSGRLPAEVDPRDGEVLLHPSRLRLGRLSLERT
jgi:hypothetical protein